LITGPENKQATSSEAPNPAAHVSREDPQFVLTMLEADQLVAAKGRSRFGRRQLSLGARIVLWSLRVYVVVMLIIVLVSVLRAIHQGG